MNSEHKDFQKEYDVKWVPYWEEYVQVIKWINTS